MRILFALALLAALGGPEVAYLAGVVLGAVEARSVVVLDGMVTSVAALLAVMLQPAVASHLIAGNRPADCNYCINIVISPAYPFNHHIAFNGRT